MTNYEWLVKTDRLEDFIFDIRKEYQQAITGKGTTNCSTTVETTVDLEEKYGIYFEWGDHKSEIIADWLQKEHPVDTYVNIEEVYKAINDSRENGVINEITLRNSLRLISAMHGKVIEDDT